MNLYLPSKVSWSQGGTQASITQVTDYPRANTSQLQMQFGQTGSIHRVSANSGVGGREDSRFGERQQGGRRGRLRGNSWRCSGPGKMATAWRLEFEMPLYLEAVDKENPNTVALMRGPLAMFGVGEIPARLTRAQLLAASALAQGLGRLRREDRFRRRW